MSFTDNKTRRWLSGLLVIAAAGAIAIEVLGLAGVSPVAAFSPLLFIGAYGLSLRDDHGARAVPAAEAAPPGTRGADCRRRCDGADRQRAWLRRRQRGAGGLPGP